jgi:hypothetical protein
LIIRARACGRIALATCLQLKRRSLKTEYKLQGYMHIDRISTACSLVELDDYVLPKRLWPHSEQCRSGRLIGKTKQSREDCLSRYPDQVLTSCHKCGALAPHLWQDGGTLRQPCNYATRDAAMWRLGATVLGELLHAISTGNVLLCKRHERANVVADEHDVQADRVARVLSE